MKEGRKGKKEGARKTKKKNYNVGLYGVELKGYDDDLKMSDGWDMRKNKSQGSPLTLISVTKSSAQDSSPPQILEQSEGRELGLGQGRARLRSIKSWTNHRLSKFISNAVEKVLYQDNRAQLYNEAGDINDVGEEGHASVDINSENQDYGTEDLADEMDDRMGWAEGATATTTAGIQERELDDGEENPNYYYNNEPRRPRDMPYWFPDWLTNKTLYPSKLCPSSTTTATNFGTIAVDQHDLLSNISDSASAKRPRRSPALDPPTSLARTWYAKSTL
ncbi:hypothetical protein BKA57DRAFT_494611 [Linnemannia elongata]|nr:hypothetical protein BKA57DRAFT_494611 [Linnemannia elongata]